MEDTIKRTKMLPTEWEQTFAKRMFGTGNVSRIYKKHLNTQYKENNTMKCIQKI